MSRPLILRWNRRHPSRGALLVEALLAVMILSIGLTVIIRSLMTSLRATSYTADYSMAVFLLEDKINGLMQNGFIEDGHSEEENLEAPFEKFVYRIEAHNIKDADKPGNLNQVELSLSWPSGRKMRKIFLTTYLLNQKPAS